MSKVEAGERLTDQVNEAIAQLQEELAQGHTKNFLELLEFYAAFRSYSFGNCMLILSQLPIATRCAGYKAWEKMGHQVRKGEKALWIRGPMLRKEPDPLTGEIKERLVGWIGLPVFDVSQLEGDVKLPDDRHALEGDYRSFYDHACQRATASGLDVSEKLLPNGTKGVSMKGKIIIHPDQSDAEKCLALWHELAHQLLEHHDRHGDTTIQERELVSESAAFVIARIFGLDNPFSRDYILNWKGTTERLQESLSEVHLAVKRIIAMMEYIEPVALAAD